MLRKDLWRPLATVTFPSGQQGLTAYRELREYRKRHEHEWTYEDLKARTRKAAGRRLQNQKANTVADLAAVLQRQDKIASFHREVEERETQQIEKATLSANARIAELKSSMIPLRQKMLDGDQKATEEYKAAKAEKLRLRRALSKPMPHLALKHRYHPANDPSPEKPASSRRKYHFPRISMQGLRIKWANMADAEFARTWPSSVTHEALEEANARTRHIHPPVTAPPPPPSDLEQTQIQKDAATAAAKLKSGPQSQTSITQQAPKTESSPWMDRLLVRLRDGAT